MKIKTRDLKKHYRSVEQRVKGYNIDLSEGSWYNLWHTHLDWSGITTFSEKHRIRHIKYYDMLFDKIESQTESCKRNFQTWVIIDGQNGCMDAIYLHTENPYSEFPFIIGNLEREAKIPSFITKTLDLNKFNIGRFKLNDSYSYLIERKGLGISVFTPSPSASH